MLFCAAEARDSIFFLCVLSIENLLYNLNFVMEIFFVF